ncbi:MULTISPECIES: HAD hydrolase family protein [Anaerotruncus]|uniref:HAD hydrolase family protein n=1 Tax=Anaerotruncus TaxID=244127 RepID=UPI0008311896|nr:MULTISPECIES: HAD hydrolase family protein [Anaerotruncus]RGX55182.1 HAD family phosphatase [Anaerotruncus sp. AF02-27]
MDIRAILLDFDGTALQKDQTYISFRNKHALDAAMKKGIEVIPSTGRNEDMFPPQIAADERVRYWVTSNGARVVDRKTGEIIYQSLFTPEESAEILRIFEGQGIYSEIAAAGKIYMEKAVCAHLENYPVPPHHVWFLELGRQIELDCMSEYFLEHRIGIEKVNIYGVPEEKQQPILDALEKTGVVDVFEGAGVDIQFFPKRLNRVEALETLFGRLGIGYENVMALGDSTLDAPAIEKSGIGVAMGNASDRVKQLADYVTASSDQDGVAQAIEKFLL